MPWFLKTRADEAVALMEAEESGKRSVPDTGFAFPDRPGSEGILLGPRTVCSVVARLLLIPSSTGSAPEVRIEESRICPHS